LTLLLSTTWTAIASTSTTSAVVNTSTSGTGVPIYLVVPEKFLYG
jgi:hypothetical protein